MRAELESTEERSARESEALGAATVSLALMAYYLWHISYGILVMALSAATVSLALRHALAALWRCDRSCI